MALKFTGGKALDTKQYDHVQAELSAITVSCRKLVSELNTLEGLRKSIPSGSRTQRGLQNMRLEELRGRLADIAGTATQESKE